MKYNEDQSKQYEIPMEVTNETIRDFGIDPSKVVWTKIGNRRVRAFMVPCTKEFTGREVIMTMFPGYDFIKASRSVSKASLTDD